MYKLKDLVPALIALVLCVGMSSVLAQRPASILVGPNARVSNDDDGKLYELHVAADPTNSLNLIATGCLIHLRSTKLGTGNETRVYVSSDGGYNWNTIRIPDYESVTFSGDPQVGFGPSGTAYFVSVATEKPKNKIRVYRSEDKGLHWGPAVKLPYFDHPQLGIDRGKAGALYLSGMIEIRNRETTVYEIVAYRSTDDGRTWVGPVQVATNGDAPNLGLNNSISLPVFSDGSPFVPLHDFVDMSRGAAKRIRGETYAYGFSVSSDGGSTFAPATKLKIEGGGEIKGDGQPSYAIDNSAGPFKDRVHVVWADFAFTPAAIKSQSAATGVQTEPKTKARIWISHSVNRGATWSKPRMVADLVVSPRQQFMPTLAVNDEGIVGVAWYEAQNDPVQGVTGPVDQYFTASLDGGDTFQPAVRVSSVGTDLHSMRKASGLGIGVTDRTVAVESGWTFYRDYFGMAASNDGTFFPVWLDGRTGTHQMWTAPIRVSRLTSTELGQVPADLEEADVSNLVEGIGEPMREIFSKGAIEVPIRLRNKSQKKIYGPLRIEIIPPSPDSGILNATNGKTGLGAIFDYSAAIGGFASLEPGATTEAVVWLVGMPAMDARFPHYEFKVIGRIERSKETVPVTAPKP